MVNSINFKIYKLTISGKQELDNAIVENINLVTNDINTAEFSIIINSLDEPDIPTEGDIILIYATGKRYKGNDFSDTFLNKNYNELDVFFRNNLPDNYEKLLFLGIINTITSEINSNSFSYQFNNKYKFNCIGIENILKHIGFNSYLFYNPFLEEQIEVAGIPIFDKNNIEINNQQYFTINDLGDYWTRAKAIEYIDNNIVSPYEWLDIDIIYSLTTYQDLSYFDITNNEILSHYDFISRICGQLFHFYFYYTELENNTFKLNIKIISKASADINDNVSFVNLHSTQLNAITTKPSERIVIRYPFYGKMDGFYQIFRHPDNIANEEYYVYEINKVIDDSKFESVYREFYKEKDKHWEGLFNVLSNTPIPEWVDIELKKSIGAQNGCHSKFYIYPITIFNINGVPVNVNIEDFEVLSLNDFRLVEQIENDFIIKDWNSKKPFKNFKIELDYSQVKIDCDIPHQFAPSNYIMNYSTIEQPIFPIDDGTYVYINADIVSKNNKEYITIGNGINTTFIDIDYVPTDPLQLANYIAGFINNPVNSFNMSGQMLDFLIDYIFVMGQKINNIYVLLVFTEQPPIPINVELNLIPNNFNISRSGAYYQFSINCAKVEININELLSQFRNKIDLPIIKNNKIEINGNYDGTFYGKIKEIDYNHYKVLPEWHDEDIEENYIYVARIDEHKLGYWKNVPPSDRIIFEAILEEDKYKTSERTEIINQGTDEEIKKKNKIVPDEKLFNIIAFKMDSGNVKVIRDYDIEGNVILKYITYLDTNQYARSWAVVPDDEINYYG